MVFGFGKKSSSSQATAIEETSHDVPLDQAQPQSTSLLPVFACGAGLFSDGYVNNVIGSVSTVLGYVSSLPCHFIAEQIKHALNRAQDKMQKTYTETNNSNTVTPTPNPQPSKMSLRLPLLAQLSASFSLVIWRISGRVSTPCSCPPSFSSSLPPSLPLPTGMVRPWVSCLSLSPGKFVSNSLWPSTLDHSPLVCEPVLTFPPLS